MIPHEILAQAEAGQNGHDNLAGKDTYQIGIDPEAGYAEDQAA